MQNDTAFQAQALPEKSKRPVYLNGSALALIILGVWYLLIFMLSVFLPMFYHYVHNNAPVLVLLGVGISASLALIVSGIGVIRRAGWARPLALLGLLVLFFKIAFQALIARRQVSLFGGNWIELIFYLCISLSLYTRRSNAYFRSGSGKRFG